VTGGTAVTLADAPTSRRGSWGEDGNIVFHANAQAGLLRVSSAGGKAEPLTKVGEGEVTHRWSQVLPGTKAVLYMSSPIGNNAETSNIMIQPLPSGTPKVLLRGGYHPQYAGGHLLYIHEGTLFAVPFDLNRLEVTGQSVPVVEGVSAQPNTGGAAQFAVSQTGAFTYLPGQNAGTDSPVVWMAHDGKTSLLRTIPSNWSNPHFSPDGQRLAMDILSGNIDVWIYEWVRDTLTRLIQVTMGIPCGHVTANTSRENFCYSIQHIANIKRTNSSIIAASSINMTVNRFGRVSAKNAILRIDRWFRCRSASAR